MFEMFNVAERIGLLDTCMNVTLDGHFYGKREWRKCVWEKGWVLGDEEYPGGGGGHSGTEGGRTLVTYFAEEGVFFEDLRMSAIL